MSRKIIGVTVGTPISPAKIENDLKPEIKEYIDEQIAEHGGGGGNIGDEILTKRVLAHEVSANVIYAGENDEVSITEHGINLTPGAKLRIDGEDVIGDITTALDNIIAIQNALIGGDV